jgi:hypothetical protein
MIYFRNVSPVGISLLNTPFNITSYGLTRVFTLDQQCQFLFGPGSNYQFCQVCN